LTAETALKDLASDVEVDGSRHRVHTVNVDVHGRVRQRERRKRRPLEALGRARGLRKLVREVHELPVAEHEACPGRFYFDVASIDPARQQREQTGCDGDPADRECGRPSTI